MPLPGPVTAPSHIQFYPETLDILHFKNVYSKFKSPLTISSEFIQSNAKRGKIAILTGIVSVLSQVG